MNALEKAIFETVAYADVFQSPLTEGEIQRYLIGVRATGSDVHQALSGSPALRRVLLHLDHYYLLAGRQSNLPLRQERAAVSARLWPAAIRYGRWIGNLPGVRMVAVTGSLAVNSADSGSDLDYLVVTRPGRLWLVRAMIILLVRLTAWQKNAICPNYLITENALEIKERNLFTAHELAQMVPIAGLPVYHQMLDENGWVSDYLPNASCEVWGVKPRGIYAQWIRPLLEAVLGLPPAGWLDQWEFQRKVQKFQPQASHHAEACFTREVCKGHFGDHGERILRSFSERLKAREEVAV